VTPFNPAPAEAQPSVKEAVGQASTDAFHLTALAAALLCAAGAAINAVGIRNEELHDHDPEAVLVE